MEHGIGCMWLSGTCSKCGYAIHFGPCITKKRILEALLGEAPHMAVVAKFKVGELKRSMGNRRTTGENGEDKWVTAEVRSIHMTPVYDPDPEHENRKFWEATPSGQIDLAIVNADAASEFELDEEYYVYFSKERLL